MTLIAHIVGSIGEASRAQAEAARRQVAAAGVPLLEPLAERLAGAQHRLRPRAARRVIVVAAGDHGAGDPGIALGAAHPTVVAAQAIVDGTAALAQVARASRAPVVLVDAGTAESALLPSTAVRLGRGPSRNILREPAMTVVDAALAVEAGIALAVSLAEHEGLDVVAIGALGIGSELASAALLGAALGSPPTGLRDPDAEAAGAHGATLADAGPVELLAACGGPETALLAGLVLGAASMNIPTILDGHATGAAALAAARFAPNVVGYLVAAHAGTFTQPRVLAHLGLTPLFPVGLGHGEGTGAAMVLPLADQVAALVARG